MKRTGRIGHRPGRAVVSVVLGLSLFAAACGGDDDDDAAETTEAAAEETTAESEEPAEETTAESEAPAEETEAPAEETEAAAATPVPGGKVVVGVEAETTNPWTPAKMQCDAGCQLKIRTVYEPLVSYLDDGSYQGYLAESVTPNDDFTEWTIKLREGITFHDGEPVNADAFIENFDRQLNSFLIGASLTRVASTGDPGAKKGEYVKADDLTVTVKMNQPWTEFPISALAGQAGFLASPKWLVAADADPTLETQPVGTGPFMYKSYEPGNNFVVVKNPNYWASDANGTQLPYLDEVEFRIIPDAQSRAAALESGDVDIIQTTNGESIADFRERADEYPMIEQSEETTYLLMHVGQEGSPLQDQEVRCALAAATDAQLAVDAVQAGVNTVANGPFTPAQLGYLEDSGNQTYDPELAAEMVAAWEAENGDLTIKYSTTTDQSALTMVELISASWEEAGVTVEIAQQEQGALITSALIGDPNFNVFLWRNHAGSLDRNYIWWHSSQALPSGSLALNFGRQSDPQIDALLDENRETTDQARKKEIAEEINTIFAEQCYMVPLYWTIWGLVRQPNVMGMQDATFPNSPDQPAFGQGFPGQFPLISVWLQQ